MRYPPYRRSQTPKRHVDRRLQFLEFLVFLLSGAATRMPLSELRNFGIQLLPAVQALRQNALPVYGVLRWSSWSVHQRWVVLPVRHCAGGQCLPFCSAPELY